ncbi:MAG TPA: hypothetical protein VK841_15165 [Polyangiaceae bacterium]|nr:hypothetical protein [Polyangiaceae bacterium]
MTTDAIESAPAAPPTESPSGQWYGWQTLILDSVAAGAFAGLALGDVALRVAAPVLLALIGVAIEEASTPGCGDTGDICLRGLGGALAGGAIGYVAAVAIDAAVLARERAASVPRRKIHQATLLLMPVVNAGQTAVTAGIAGCF